MQARKSAFKIGDLVVGAYDFMEYLYYKALYPEEVPEPQSAPEGREQLSLGGILPAVVRALSLFGA